MTDITPLLPAGRQVIEGYGDGGFRIAGVRYEGSVLVLRERTIAWPVGEIGEATLDNLDAITAPESPVELLLFGTGKRMAPIGAELRGALRARGVVAEVMDTGAACRTFNVLLAEDRRVAAALIAV